MSYSPARRQDRSSLRDPSLLYHQQKRPAHHDGISSPRKTNTSYPSTFNSSPNRSPSRYTPPRLSKNRSRRHSGNNQLNQSTLSADDSIMRGAEILRSEIMRRNFDDYDESDMHRMDSPVNFPARSPSRSFSYDENDDAPLPLSLPSTPSSRRSPRHSNIFRNEEEIRRDRRPPNQRQNQFESQPPHIQHPYHSRSRSLEETDSASTDWSDPWRPPQPDISADVIDIDGRAATPPEPPGLSPPSSPGKEPRVSWEDLEENKTHFSFSHTSNAKNWSYVSDDDDSKEVNPGGYSEEKDQSDDDHTADVLARAGEILNKASEVRRSPYRESPVQKYEVPDLENDSAYDSSFLLGMNISSERGAQRTSIYPIPHGNFERSESPSPPSSPHQTRGRATVEAETSSYHSRVPAHRSQLLPRLETTHPNTFDLLKDLQQDEMPSDTVRPAPRLDAKNPSPFDLLRDLQEDEDLIFPRRDQEVFRASSQPKRQRSFQKNIHQHVTPQEQALRKEQQQKDRRRDLQFQEESTQRKEQKEEQKEEQKQVQKKETGPSPCDSIVRPSSSAYKQLMKDPGFRHAQRAGILWQSLVSQHVRFPSKWWNGSRSPPMGLGTRRLWNHLGRHRLLCCYNGNTSVSKSNVVGNLVANRGSAGRLLVHLLIRDIITCEPILDIAIGAFHPNARGVRSTPTFDPKLEDYRDIWLALRPRGEDISPIESLLTHKIVKGASMDESPLGPTKHEVHNGNMRAVFGERPPVQTAFVLESEVYELFSEQLDGSAPPAVVLLAKYLPGFQVQLGLSV